MKVNKVSANKPTFKTTSFEDGFNVVIAERAEGSSAKDSRNGLGKTLLIEIIDFTLGSNLGGTLKKEEMATWVFSTEIEVEGNVFTLTRGVDEPNYIQIQGDATKLGFTENADGSSEYHIDTFKAIMGNALFGLNAKSIKGKKNAPSYRSLISYFVRTDTTAFNDPFAYFARQQSWSKQVNNAFLLGLDWELAAKLHVLKTKLDELNEINKAIEDGALSDFGGTVGQLESERINLEAKLERTEAQLTSFKVHEQYHDVQEKADELTSDIHKILNEINLNTQIINKYTEDLRHEKGDDLQVEDIYKQAGIAFPASLSKNLEDVRQFHEAVISNRKEYLQTEIKKLTAKVGEGRQRVKELTDAKSEYMAILKSHGALEEYTLLQKDVNQQQAKINDIQSKIDRLTEVEDTISKLNVEVEEMVRVMRKDYSERLVNLAAAVKMFNENSEYLYAQPGTLSIDVSKAGYKLKVDIKRSGSDGVGSMKVFCYDLMLAEYWASIKHAPIMLVHDSKLFDGVDERQVAKAMELAKAKSQEHGFQYICTINSDRVPYDEFAEGFGEEFDDAIRQRYHDKDDTGTLLGISF